MQNHGHASNIFSYKKPSNIVIFILLVICAVIVIYPLFWMVMSSLKSYKEIYSNVWGLPAKPLFRNYVEAWKKGISRYFLNSVFVTFVTVIGVLLVASLCAFGLSRYRFKLGKFVLFICLGGLMLNPQICLIPLYILLKKTHIQNTYGAMILPYIAFRLSFSVLLIRSYFLTIPREFEESARIDGCNDMQIFEKVFLPVSKPILSTCAILTSNYAWNEFMFSVIFIDSERYRTIPSGLMTFRDALQTNWGVMLAGMVISSLPVIILFISMQAQFIRGMTAGSVKG